MKRILNPFFLLAFCASIFIISCEDDPTPVDNDYTLSGNASGSQEVPAVATAATGTISGNYNASNNTLQYAITWNGLSGSVTGIHFHGPALAGANAGILHDLGAQILTNGTSGSAGGQIILPDANEISLLNGRIYYNIHTAANVNGEIRGQVTATQ